MRKALPYLFFFFGIFCISAQKISEKGIPFIQNYLPENYGNHGKVWEICSADNGLVYMASDNGLLEFDGQNWNRFRNYKGYTRSLCVANDSVIYVGADMDFGVWKKDKYQKFNYTSFYPYTKKIGGVNEEFWGTYKLGSNVIFVSHQNIYTYNGKKVSKISAPTRFLDSFQVDGKIFLSDENKGLFQFDGTKIIQIFQNSLEISGIFKNGNILYIVTKDKGIFQFSNGSLVPFQTEVNSEIIKNKVFSFTQIQNKYLAFGTILNGLYITDLNGKVIQHISKSKGLPNNTVLSLHFQKNGKLWLGLDYGISSININQNITYFQNINSDFGTGYAVAQKDDLFYLGTNQGLYIANWTALNNNLDANPFKIIGGSEGQVWTLQNIDGKILCGHDKGLFEVDGNFLTKIYNEAGIMCLLKYQDRYLFAGNYNGISIFQKEGNSWKFLKKMNTILGAVSQIIQEGNTIFWVNIPNYGLIKFDLDQNLNVQNRKIINSKEFMGYFPSIFKDQNGIHVITSASQYFYNPSKEKFLEEKVTAKNKMVKNLFSGFYRPIIFNENYGFYSINNGFALEERKSSTENMELSSKLLFRKANAYNNYKTLDLQDGESFPFKLNNIKISYILPNEEGVEYQYFLENFSKGWSDWNDKNFADFLDLPEGNYTLQVKAKKGNKISEIQKFGFKINAPWYRSFWSYLLYLALFAGIVYLLRKYQENKLKKQKLEMLKKEQNSLREQAEKHRQEMLLEKQKQLEQEKNYLKDEIRNKTIELATKAKEDEDKIRILHSISGKISEIESNPNISKIRLGEIRRMLKTYLETEDHTFEIQMDDLHQDFFKAMKKNFPLLSIYDLRLCAYLKIGLNSREMADILQVLPSSINVSRSRLRKKLGLQPEDDLFEFLNKIK